MWLSALTAAVALAAPLPGAGAGRGAPRADFYVSPRGSDHWSGRLAAPNPARTDGPFATLERARDALRRQRASGRARRPATVLLRGGTYRLSRPFELLPEDSGARGAPVVYAAYPGERPILSGGRRIRGWRPLAGGRWETELTAVRQGRWYFRQLFVNGRRAARPRLPEEGFVPLAGSASPEVSAFRYREGDIRSEWANRDDLEVVVLQFWMAARLRIARLDSETRTVTFTGGSWRPLSWSRGYYVENVREAMDAPGEWYLDRPTGILTYVPRPGEEMENAEVVAPALEHVVQFRGDGAAERVVQHVTLRGLTFAHTAWPLPQAGYAYPQAELPVTAAVHVEGARYCAFEECEVAHVDSWGIALGRGCQDNRVVGCRFHDIGAGGLRIGEAENRPLDAEEACRALVADNTFSDGALTYPGSPAIWVGQSSGNRIVHNEVQGPWQWAVSLGWNWNYMPPNRTRDNIVEDNHFHHVGTGVLGAHSVIYMLGISPGTVVRRNWVHRSAGYGLGFDAASSGILAEDNLVHDMGQGGLHFNWYCLGNIVQNNIFAFGKDAQMTRYGDPPQGNDTNCNIFQRNIVYWRNSKLYYESRWDNFRVVQDYNVYWDASGAPVTFLGFSFDEWRAKGLDLHSLVADPLFRDADARNFTLRPDSPALKLGFRPLDLRGVGPRRRQRGITALR